MKTNNERCWKTINKIYIKYHDEEWGVPVHNDNILFEFLVLGGFQAGLTWELVLNKREAFRKAFDNFEPNKIATYSNQKIAKLMKNSEIIRNKAKIMAAIHNASMFLNIQNEYGSFDNYIWRFKNENRIKPVCSDFLDLPTKSDKSISMSKDLKIRGFKFVGPTICYAFMQAVGIVNDHLINCFRHDQINSFNGGC